MKTKLPLFSAILLSTLLTVEVQAGTLDDIGFTDLKLELGSALPDGSSIAVTQVEAPVSGACAPDMTRSEFSNITFNDNTLSVCSGVSGHATSVATRFYGTVTSALTAIGTVDLYEAIDWLSTGFLRTTEGVSPNIVDTRLANHSWVGDVDIYNGEILLRVDFVIGVDEFIQVVAMSATPSTKHLLSDSFNAIVVGLSNGSSGTGTSVLDTVYTGGRAKPDIVAPQANISTATPRVASAAALLMDYAHTNSLLSNGSTSNRGNVITIFNAERSETIKAMLMAGADRNTLGNTSSIDITDYRVDLVNQTSNGLDKRFGAGQVNVYNSYHILAGGEQNSTEDGGTTIANTGFDYDPAFGGLSSSNVAATYGFTTGAIGGQKLKASLIWNLQVAASNVLYDLDLQLIDVTDGNAVVASSTSTIDNTENIWFDLASNNDYQLKVIPGAGQADFEWDYALAWQMVVPGVTVVETDSATITAEDGTTDTFTVVLDSPPAGDVTINLVSSDTGEGTVSPSSLTFTSANWSTLQTVTVTGVNDAVDDGDKNYSIDFTVSSATDTNYNGMTLPGVSASNTDDDATFSFTDQTDVALNSLITSNAVVVTGLLNTTAIALTGGEYSINGGIYTSTNGSINNNDSITLQTTSSVAGSTSVNVILTIGDVGDTFSVTTETDTDADGVGDSTDAFPNDPDETVDTDSDGVGDNADAFPSDATETLDTDGDGVGDNADAFPNNIAASVDADNDGKPDEWNANCDASCQDGSGLVLDAWLGDTDNDGVVNINDAFPNNPAETTDTDSDGVGDNADVFPNDPNETADADADGVGDNADAFPTNIAASVDVDNDGKPEAWNASCDVTCQDKSGLTLDVATDAATGTSTSSGGGGSLGLLWLLLPLFITAGRRRVS